jgi:heterodisulfide reductase subunit B
MERIAEEIKTNYEGCVSYYGHYELDPENNIVIHHVEGSLFPNWEGNEIVAILIWEHHR